MMRKLYVLLLLCFGCALNAQIIDIPDAILKAYLINANPQNQRASDTYPASTYITIDTNGDGQIQVSEAALVRYIRISDSTFQLNISSLAGVEQFVNLKHLICTAFLDFFNPADFIGLERLELGYYYPATTLDITPMINLKTFLIDHAYNLSSINLNGLMNLENVLIEYCEDLALLDLSGLPNLKRAYCDENALTSLNVSGLTNLELLYCDHNQLTSVDLDGLINLRVYTCSDNQFTTSTLDMTGFPNLQKLDCGYNNLTALNVSGNTLLYWLACAGNQLTTLDTHGLTFLRYVLCGYNRLSTLDFRDSRELQRLECPSNLLTSLFIKNNSNEYLYFSHNPNLSYICADTGQLGQVQSLVNSDGYTGCTVADDCFVLADADFETNDAVVLYPNPATNELQLKVAADTEISSLTIYNVLGQSVLSVSDFKEISSLDVSSLKHGTYFIRIVSNKGILNKKFVKQ